MMEFDRTIIIADSNPHVRRFLKREMTAAGYDVLLAFNLHDLLRLTFEHISIDLIIVDPDFPNIAAHDLLARLNNRVPRVPIVVHTHDISIDCDLKGMIGIYVVEKSGDSTEQLKQLAGRLLQATSGCNPEVPAPSTASTSSNSVTTDATTGKHQREL